MRGNYCLAARQGSAWPGSFPPRRAGGCERAVRTGRTSPHGIALVAHADPRRHAGLFEKVISKLQIPPELRRRVPIERGKALFGHAERKGMHPDVLLARAQRRRDERPDIVDALIGHGVAASRDAGAVHHERRAGPLVLAVEHVRVSQVESAVVMAVGIELTFRDGVKALGRLAVALDQLGTEPTRPGADGIGGE